ncbi:MAG TPA: hypothetical protein DDW54_01420 [Clostridiales bacterium]|nr:hypothetical protein [Clostridiales bacterium]
MTKLILIRHGYSLYNKIKKYTGQTDVPLTEEGLSQAEKTAEYVAENYRVDRIISSDLKRCVDTVKPLSERTGVEIETEKGLREIAGGLWEGKTVEEIKALFPEDYDAYVNDIGNARCTGGESFVEVADRAYKTIDGIARENDGKNVVICTHNGVIIGFFAAIFNATREEMQNIDGVTNDSVTEIDYENGKYTVIKRSYDAHLGALKTVVTEKGLR